MRPEFIERTLPLPNDWLQSGGELCAIRVAGDSMKPITNESTIAILDTLQKSPRLLVNKMVAVREGNEISIRWLRQDGKLYLLAPQQESLTNPIRQLRSEGDFSIVGAVVLLIRQA